MTQFLHLFQVFLILLLKILNSSNQKSNIKHPNFHLYSKMTKEKLLNLVKIIFFTLTYEQLPDNLVVQSSSPLMIDFTLWVCIMSTQLRIELERVSTLTEQFGKF